ncbi:MAG: UDP-N-acetyl-D-mannosamine dehydrogenase, partial [Candidatus Pacebacteria bacterium CG10_big_fil_rev_8_21_14_0_10_56_10]
MSAPQVGPEVTVLGLGYIGLPTALLLADAGVRVRGVDVDRSKLRRLKAGRLPFAEPGLDKLWRRV